MEKGKTATERLTSVRRMMIDDMWGWCSYIGQLLRSNELRTGMQALGKLQRNLSLLAASVGLEGDERCDECDDEV